MSDHFSRPPIRTGKLYCAPWCGGGCTWVAFQEATQAAAKLCRKLGQNWKPRVWENLGWHYGAELLTAKDFRLKIYAIKHRAKTEYHALLGDAGGEAIWTDEFFSTDPRKVAAHQLELAERYVMAQAARIIRLRKAMLKPASALTKAHLTLQKGAL